VDLGAKVIGLSLNIPTNPSNFEVSHVNELILDVRGDISNLNLVKGVVKEHKPDFIFHLAAQALVRTAYDDPITTLKTNSIGTANILEALKESNHKAIAIMITSDKAYDNVEWLWGYRETDILGGKDPYSASKAMAELVIRTYYESFFKAENSKIRIGIARAGNVIGGGDWAKDRIIPDCVRYWSKKQKAELRNPKATRPWQHVLEVIGGYLSLAINLKFNRDLHGESFNFGPGLSKEYSVIELVKTMSKHWEKVSWTAIPKSKKKYYESGLLRLNCNKAKKILKWKSILKFEETISMVAKWYKCYHEDSKNINKITELQIETYEKLLKKRSIAKL
jgi:CDP-glucose 4,6-dehydratase